LITTPTFSLKTLTELPANYYTDRKEKFTKENIDAFWENVIQFARKTTSNRGTSSGSKIRNVGNNPKIKSNIIGYFDTISPSQKLLL
jgi:hypothetical protein